MNHFKILQNDTLEFSHLNYDAPAGLWKKENTIILNQIKINVFIEGNFSVFTNGTLHTPVYGDIFFLKPMQMHYGQIKEAMHINYYQLDISQDVFSIIPDGEILLNSLLNETDGKESFIRPNSSDKTKAIKLCEEIEAAINSDEKFLAFAKVVEFLSFLRTLYLYNTKSDGTTCSKRTKEIIAFIESRYGENVTIQSISNALGISSSFISRIFRNDIGITVHEYLNRYRILKATDLLKTKSVTECSYLCGFSDTSHFIAVFKKHTGATPMKYKNENLIACK